jgi:hypothetical protein
MNQTGKNMQPYVLRANGVSYRFSEFAALLAQVEYLGLELYEIECVDDEPATKTVRNLMTGKEIEIAVDTPYCCDPSSETYWSL